MADKEKVVDEPKPEGEAQVEEKKESVKLGELAAVFGVLQQLAQVDVKASTGRIIGKMLTRVEAELKTREDQRKKLVEKYGEPVDGDEKNKQILTPAQGGDPESWRLFRDEIEEMDEQAVDLSGLSTLRVRDFKTSKGEADIKPAMFTVLDRLGLLEE